RRDLPLARGRPGDRFRRPAAPAGRGGRARRLGAARSRGGVGGHGRRRRPHCRAGGRRAAPPRGAAGMSGPGVLVTRPAGEADPLVEELRRRGIEVRAVPTVALEPIPFEAPDLAAYDWVVVTSTSGARSLLAGTGLRPGPRWAAVGPVTAQELAGL